MSIEVSLNIFSGRTNPAWFLDETKASELGRLLANLSNPSEKKSERRLGYRGFLIRGGPLVEAGERIRVFRGVVELPGRSFVDRNRNLERWLLESAGAAIPPDLRAEVLEDLEAQLR